MSIATTVRTAGPYAGTGSLVALPFAFKVFAASDLVVQRTNVAGDVATLTLTTHYSVSLNADQDTSPGGTVTLVTALAVGETAALTSSVSATQPLQLASGGPFLPGQIEDALDRAMIVVQQQGVLGEQTLRVPLGETALILPSADQRANKALLFDADGDPYLAAPASGSAADLALSIASTASGKGAALVGVEDSGGWFTGADGEAVLAELGRPNGAFAYDLNALRYITPSLWAAILDYTSTDDHTAQLQAAINSFGASGSVARGRLYIPGGKWNLNTASLVLPFEVSVRGAGGRTTQICVGGDWDAFTWDSAAPSFSRQVQITDMWIKGPGYGKQGATTITMAQAYTASSAGTNLANIAATYPGVAPYANASAININHPWGIDSLTLHRLWIEEFPNIGIRTNQPISGATANCFQFSDWSSLYLRYCNIGISLGFGFTGESSFSNICSQFMLTSCCDFTINGVVTGPQGVNFVNLAGGWSPYGVRMLAGTAGIIKFDMLHMESCTSAGLYLNSASISKVVLVSPWIAKCVKGILGDAGGPVVIYDGTWQGAGNTTDNYIDLNAASNFVVQLVGQQVVVAPSSGSAPTDHIAAADISSVRGAFQRKSATAGTFSTAMNQSTFLQTRGIAGEASTVPASNLSGSTGIANGATSASVTFARTEADASYRIVPTVSNGAASGATWTPAISIGSKTTGGFTAYFSGAAPAGGWVIEWVLMR
jgi:hypothetical protein